MDPKKEREYADEIPDDEETERPEPYEPSKQYKDQEKYGNLKTKPILIWTAQGEYTKKMEKGDLFDKKWLD